MKVTLKQFIQTMASGALSRFVNDADLPAAIKYRLASIWKRALEETEQYEKNRTELINKYAETDSDGELKRDKNGGVIWIDAVARKEFETEFKDLQAETIDFSGQMIKADGKIDSKLSAADLSSLDWLIFMPEAEDEMAAKNGKSGSTPEDLLEMSASV